MQIKLHINLKFSDVNYKLFLSRINQFYNFNYDGADFKNSLIGQLSYKVEDSFDPAYQQEVKTTIANYLLFLTHTKITDNINQMLTGLINYNLNKAVNPWTKDNVNDKFKDWVNYNGTSTQWNQHININHPTNIAIKRRPNKS